MKLTIIFPLLVSIVIVPFALSAQPSERKFVSVNGTQLAYKTFNLDKRKAGEPVLVFESGFGSGGGNFEPLLSSFTQNIPGIFYDRNGIGESAQDSSIRNDADVIKRLHGMLETLKIAPPYILVGHSLGGPYIRLFAVSYPEQVVGLFFIDATDFMLTKQEDSIVKKNYFQPHRLHRYMADQYAGNEWRHFFTGRIEGRSTPDIIGFGTGVF